MSKAAVKKLKSQPLVARKKAASKPAKAVPEPSPAYSAGTMPLPVRISLEQNDRLKRLRDRSGVPIQEIVRRSIDAFLAANPHSVPPKEIA